MTHRVGAKGQVVIPKDVREAIGLTPGAEVDFRLQGQSVVLRPRKKLPSLRGTLPRTGMADRLLEDRARERR